MRRMPQDYPPTLVRPLGSPTIYADLRVEHVGCFLRKHWHVRRQHENECLVVIGRGEGYLRIPGRETLKVFPGSVFVPPVDRETEHGPWPDTSWDEYYIEISGPGLSRWKALGLWPAGPDSGRLANPSWAMARLDELQSFVAEQPFGVADLAIAEVERFLVELALNLRRKDLSGASLEAAGSFLAWCMEHLGEEVDFARASERFGVSYPHLRRAIRRLTGMPLKAYLEHRRCERAAQLLVNTDWEVRRIAREVGFKFPSAFSRTFGRVYGLPPREHRKRAELP